MIKKTAIIGGGLAGCETAWQLAGQGGQVTLYEMKPEKYSPAHKSPHLAELVCSNSFRSNEENTAVGLLKQEMRKAGSLIMEVAEKTKVPAGKALAVDRHRFAEGITYKVEDMPKLDLKRKEIKDLADPELTGFDRAIIAAGPLASESLANSLISKIGQQELYFYDAMAPIVRADSIDMVKAFWGSRYDPTSKDYLNCPLTEQEYHTFIEALLKEEQVELKEFESVVHFEGCLPIETMAARGEMTLAFGPMKPVGLVDPRTGKRPFAVVQLRAENREKTMFNLVGFQTKLTYSAQKRVFRLIPGLEEAQFERLGSIHRNTFVNSPKVLNQDLELKPCPKVFLAGQITGVEGYVESAACGLWLGHYLAGLDRNQNIDLPPTETALGGLLRHLQSSQENFQPMNVNFGLLPKLEGKIKKSKRKELYVKRAKRAWDNWWLEIEGQKS